MGINHITLVGTVLRDPEKRMTQDGVPTATMTVAVKRPPRQDGQVSEMTDNIRVVVWRGLVESIEKLRKGDVVSVEGRLRTRTDTAPDGRKRKFVDVDAQSVERISAGAPTDEPTYVEEAEPAFASEADEIPF